MCLNYSFSGKNSPADHLPVVLTDPSCPRDASLMVVPLTCRVAAHEANHPYGPLRMGRGDHQGLLVLASVAAVLLAFVGRESVAGIDVNYELVRQLKTQTDKHANTLDKVNHTENYFKSAGDYKWDPRIEISDDGKNETMTNPDDY